MGIRSVRRDGTGRRRARCRPHPTNRCERILATEERAGHHQSPVTSAVSSARAIEHVDSLRSWLEEEASAGRTVFGYGAASRAVALFSRAGIDADLLAAVADASPAKQGRRMPGTDIPIVSPDELLAAKPDRVLLTLPDLLPEVSAQFPELDGRWKVDGDYPLPDVNDERQEIGMTTVLFNPDLPMTNVARGCTAARSWCMRRRPDPSLSSQHARELIAEAFGSLDPQTAQFDMPVEDFAALLADLKPKFIHHPESKKLIKSLLDPTLVATSTGPTSTSRACALRHRTTISPRVSPMRFIRIGTPGTPRRSAS